MFTNKTIFYIPIYRQTEKQYYAEIKNDFEKREKNNLKEIAEEEYRKIWLDEKNKEGRYNRWAERENFSSWDLNQIIGWIEFYAHASKIKANLWFIKSGRIDKRPKNKSFICKGNLGEVVDTLDIKKRELLPAILKFVDEVRKGEYGYKYITKYFIPDKMFLTSSMFLDSNALLKMFIKRLYNQRQQRPLSSMRFN